MVRNRRFDLAYAAAEDGSGRIRRRRLDPAMRLLTPQFVIEKMLAMVRTPIAESLQEAHVRSV
jgi:hypothetical protein